MNTSSLVHKVWNFSHTLRDDGAGYGNFKIERIRAARVTVKKPCGIKAKGAQ